MIQSYDAGDSITLPGHSPVQSNKISKICEILLQVKRSTAPLGLIVYGEDHFLIRGPKPDAAMARYLVRRWIFSSIEDLLGTSPPIPANWQITTSEFSESPVSASLKVVHGMMTPSAVRRLAGVRATMAETSDRNS